MDTTFQRLLLTASTAAAAELPPDNVDCGYNPLSGFDELICSDECSHYGRHLIEQRILTLKPPPFIGKSTSLSPNVRVPVDIQGVRTVPVNPKDPIGIIGAGVGGLYAAMILQSLGIPFQIMEASTRVGGHLYTYRFPPDDNDYFDVGAMHFPAGRIMKRLFHLFNCKQLNPCIMPMDRQNLRSYLAEYNPGTIKGGFLLYNGIRCGMDDEPDPPADFFHFGTNEGGDVDEDFINVGYGKLAGDAITTFAFGLMKDIASNPPRKVGWKKLMRFDEYSVRGYMADCMKIPQSAINWCETRWRDTGGLDLALSQTVLSILPFWSQRWFHLRGGAQVLPDFMARYIRENAGPDALKTSQAVTAIGTPHDKVIDVTVSSADGKSDVRSFQHIISTVSLGCLRKFKFDDGFLDYGQRNALRQLQSNPAVKIGFKFKSAWWTKLLNITGGYSFTDRSVRMVCYPYHQSTTVLVVSFTSTRDAMHFGGLISAGQDEQLKTLIFQDLAAIHDLSADYLRDQYVAHFAFDWYQDPFSAGGFPYFGPGQFSTLYANLSRPAGRGRLHFAGEALSVRHPWVVAALDSSWRAIDQILMLSYPIQKREEFHIKWGRNEEWNYEGRDLISEFLLASSSDLIFPQSDL